MNPFHSLQRLLIGLLCLLPFVGAGAALAQSAPRIVSFDIEQVRRIAPGVELNFTVNGTPGARAVIRLDGVQRSVVLDETKSGVYQGSFVVSSRDSIKAEHGVTATLTLNNQSATAKLDEPLVTGIRPRTPTARIEAFDMQAPAELRGGNEILFSVRGTPGGQATVTLSGVTGRTNLDEVKPGEYTGSYVIRNSDRLSTGTQATASLRVGERVATAPFVRSAPVAPVAVRCDTCGVIELVAAGEEKSKDNTLGTIAGGVAGALLGSQVGSGRGTTAAQVAGAVGGAYAGNRIQANMGKNAYVDVTVRLQTGAAQVVRFEKDPGFKVGDRVRLVNGQIQREP